MTAIRIQVTAEDCAAAGPCPRPGTTIPGAWKNPVELGIARAAAVDVDVDGDDDACVATIGTREGATLVVALPDYVTKRLDGYYNADPALMEPFAFRLELDDWLVDFFRSAE